MKDPIGTYQCRDCDTQFEIQHSSVVEAYEGWQPTCPACGTRNDIQDVSNTANL